MEPVGYFHQHGLRVPLLSKLLLLVTSAQKLVVTLQSGHSAIRPTQRNMSNLVRMVLPDDQNARARLTLAAQAFDAAKERAEAHGKTLESYLKVFTETRLSREKAEAEGRAENPTEWSPVNGELAGLVFSTMSNSALATREASKAAASCVQAAQDWRHFALAKLQKKQKEGTPEAQMALLETQVKEAEAAVQRWRNEVSEYEKSEAGQSSQLAFTAPFFNQFK